MALVSTDTKLEARELLQSIAAVELYRAQIEVAKYLELAYHGVSDHPDDTKEVRMIAHSARSWHMMTTGLMKSFMVTAKHIVSTMIPMIFDAVDLEDKDLIRDCFSLIFTRAQEMKTEAMDTGQKCYVIQEKLKKEKKKMDQDFRHLKSYRDKWMESTENLGDARSLVEASARLGDVDRQFSRIIQFWENMVATLRFLKDDTQAGEVYLKKLENTKYAERFKASIQRAEHGWNGFVKICGDYVFACENDEKVAIKVLYSFLSASLDDVPKHAREKRMRAIESEIEENIKIDEEGDVE